MEIASPYGKIKILYEDNHVLAAVKPPNLPSQSDLSGDSDMLTLLKDYIAQKYNKPGQAYLGLVHRLDRPVGGVMVFARTSKAAARLSEQFSAHSTQKTYLAVLEKETNTPMRLENYLTQKQGQSVRVLTSPAPGAKRASLISEPIACRQGLTLSRVTLETGRKHQIRAQHAFAGCPIWGDNRYGHGRPGMQIALWAMSLTIEHPTTHAKIALCCPPPMTRPWDGFRAEIENLTHAYEKEQNDEKTEA